MNNITPEINMQGFPANLTETQLAVWRSRFDKLARDFLRETGEVGVSIALSTSPLPPGTGINKSLPGKPLDQQKRNSDELTTEERANQYKAREPLYDFDFLILPWDVKEEVLSAVNLIRLESKIFDEWILRKIEPFPRMALNFHGEPGTGKSLAAHAVAHKL